MKRVYFLIIYLLTFGFLNSKDITKISSFYLSQENNILIGNPGSFFVTNYGNIFLLDQKIADIKVFNLKGRLIKVFGRKGNGPEEFTRPLFSAYREPFFSFLDIKKRTIFIYKINKDFNFKFEKKFLSLFPPLDFLFINKNKFIFNGFKVNGQGKWFGLYTYDIEHSEYNYIMPIEKCYGLNSYSEYKNAMINKLRFIGVSRFCDFSGKYIFSVWTGNLRILKFNRLTKKISYFGKYTSNYIKPDFSLKRKKAITSRNQPLSKKFYYGGSYIVKMFIANLKDIYLIYTTKLKSSGPIKIIVQKYNLDGVFKKEFRILTLNTDFYGDIFFYFNKRSNKLYVLDTETTEDFNQNFKMYEFKVSE